MEKGEQEVRSSSNTFNTLLRIVSTECRIDRLVCAQENSNGVRWNLIIRVLLVGQVSWLSSYCFLCLLLMLLPLLLLLPARLLLAVDAQANTCYGIALNDLERPVITQGCRFGDRICTTWEAYLRREIRGFRVRHEPRA